jgi:hypothetical protein
MSEETTFTWSLPPGFERLGALPVRLRSRRGALVASGVSGRALAVTPGSYLVSITLPDGREIISDQPIELGGTEPVVPPDFDDELLASVPLQSFVPGAPVPPPPPMMAAVGPAVAGAPAPEAPPSEQPATVTALRFQGDWTGIWNEEAAPVVSFGADIAAGRVEIGERPVRIDRGDAPDELLGFPVAAGRRLFVVPFDVAVPRSSGERRSIFVQLKNDGSSLRFTSPVSAETNSFLEFVDRNLISESTRLARDLLTYGSGEGNPPSLLRAIVAAYVLLRVNELDGVEPHLDRLMSIAADVPDAHVIRAEVLARLGRHAEAIRALREGYSTGCPWLRSGMSHLLERLRFYLEVDAGSFPFKLGDELDQFATWKKRLERMARRLDTTELFTTFTID